MKRLILNQTKIWFCWALMCFMISKAFAQDVTVTVNATQNKRFISPYIYGKNEDFDKSNQFYKDAGLRFARMNQGNNATGYNWRNKLTIHADWYNNVYTADWDARALKLKNDFPNIQGMFAFQLLGRVASNNQNNFDDWGFNQAQYWSGLNQNLAGGGTPDTNGGSKALIDGNVNLFTKPWPADSSVAILNHWFGANGLGLNRNQFMYWNMDNEVDIWDGTHDYAMPTLISASAFMDRYIELAKKAKALYPGIKLCGPVTTSEWQWYKWSNESIYVDGRYYPWIEYFIKRLGDEYKATGIKLVDVVDIHNYPWYNKDSNYDAEALQGHRIYYDETYDFPGSNGIRTSAGGWDESLKKQYIFKRIEGWLNEHFGADHGITTGVSEWGTMSNSNANLESVIYASHLGTFANNGVELFSPWNWSVGMWETLHLFSRNAKKYSVASTSSLENTVSAYSSVNENSDSLTVIVVNRDLSGSRTVTINLSNFIVDNGTYQTLQLSSLPQGTETFVSHTQNALKQNTVTVTSNSMTITVPALSTTAILLKKCVSTAVVPYLQINGGTWVGTASASVAVGSSVKFGPQPTTGGSWRWSGPNGFSATTREITISNIQNTQAGNYTVKYTNSNGCESTQSFFVSVTSGTGSILREYWTGITGTALSSLTTNSNYPNSPTGTSQLSTLEAPTNWADNYGSRIRGYIHPPVSGSYTFWVAGDDNTELYLSTNDNPANRTRIAYVNGWTNSKEWNKYATQQSAAIQLTAGQKYYIELLHKEGTGGDNLAVAWQGPANSQQVIGGSYLSLYVPAITVRARGTVGGETIDLRVNGSTVATWTLTTSFADYTASGNGAVTVHFINDSGQRDVQVDYVTIGTLTYQSENQATNTGVWSGTCGGSNSEWLNCNGYISYTTGGTSAAGKSSAEVNDENSGADAISIYPNPAKDGRFTIMLPEISENVVVKIYDGQGRILYEKIMKGDTKIEFDSGLKPGLYFVKINSGVFSATKKIIVN